MHTVCSYSIAHINSQSNDCIVDYHHGYDSLKNLCETLTNYSIKIVESCDLKEECNELTTIQEQNYDNSDTCYSCNKEFSKDLKNPNHCKLKKVITHDPYTGKYTGASHSICNLRYKPQKDIPFMIHNGSNYNFKLLIRCTAEHFKKDIYLIPENTEKNMALSFPIYETVLKNEEDHDNDDKKKNKVITHKLRFIDSYRLMTSSLDTAVNN